MNNDTKDGREIVNDLLDDLEERGWTIRDYNPRVDPCEPIGLQIDLEYDVEPDHHHFEVRSEAVSELVELRTVIEELDSESHDNGASLSDVLAAASDRFDRTDREIRTGIKKLKSRGDVYEPSDGRLRVT